MQEKPGVESNSCATVALCHLPKPANPGPELYILR